MAEYLRTFLIGGGIISLSKYVSSHFNPAYSGLLGAAPVSLITSFFLINDKVKEKYFRGALLSDSLIFLSIFIILTIRHFNESIPINYIATLGLFIWGIIGYLIVRFFIIPYTKNK
jgi:hypothetical protein|uniref:DUF3147 family protein n=1 Tax=viral metagenome TaxID=1070528 RepID=A0A6C0CVF8_9ZZZZ